VDPIFAWIEQSDLSVWVRESVSWFAFPGILTVHAIGLALVAGTCVVIDLRVLGFLPGVPLKAMARFIPVVWVGLVLNVSSGLLLLIGYPTKGLTNPMFYVKMLCIAVGLTLLVAIRNDVLRWGEGALGGGARTMAGYSLVMWAGATVAGRLLAYTCSRLMVDFGSCF
jgi:hypothetical protein